MKHDSILSALAQTFRRYPAIERAVLFGSRARGDHREQSDYDVAIYGALPTSDKTALRIFCAEDLPTLHKVDLIFMSEQDGTPIAESIQREGIIFYDKDRK
ncbi:MAG TPA: nucleotidyltransferase domain-containing protein [Candidatus Gallimonas intestinigallinarum]|uniref:Nucleotidyltransferase domain-containing protein n=1 Tax=Candidatus Gallimonas intestinigallinarum TaxID=2838604 RepID=A0A9D2IVF4_9FIRM|nr:nucleotidyltransferase domain-containing protein [Candidatus Gallimonas intestinigallinarum]